MRYAAPLFAVLFLLTGCASAVAGAAIASAADSNEDKVNRYVNTHDVSNRVAKAMYEGRIIKGMTKDQAGFMTGLAGYDCESEADGANATVWTCQDPDPMHVGTYKIYFEEGKVTESEL